MRENLREGGNAADDAADFPSSARERAAAGNLQADGLHDGIFAAAAGGDAVRRMCAGTRGKMQ